MAGYSWRLNWPDKGVDEEAQQPAEGTLRIGLGLGLGVMLGLELMLAVSEGDGVAGLGEGLPLPGLAARGPVLFPPLNPHCTSLASGNHGPAARNTPQCQPLQGYFSLGGGHWASLAGREVGGGLHPEPQLGVIQTKPSWLPRRAPKTTRWPSYKKELCNHTRACFPSSCLVCY
jgi:hypothetical protein